MSQLQISSEPIRLLRIREVIERVGLSRSTIYAKMDLHSKSYDSTFPQRVKLGGGVAGAIGFIESELNSWILSRERSGALEIV